MKKKYDIYSSNQNNENINNNISDESLIQNYEKEKYFLPNDNNYTLEHKRQTSTKPQIHQKGDKYPFYFQYGNEATNLNEFSSYKKPDYKIKYQIDKLNINNHPNIILRNNNNNLNWYETFKNSNFYNQWSIKKIYLEEENKENNNKDNNAYNNNEFCLENEINKIAKSFRALNNRKKNSQLKPYLIKNKYAELF